MYGRNNPLRRVDPNGQIDYDIITIPVNVVVGRDPGGRTTAQMKALVERNIAEARRFLNEAGIALKVRWFDADLTPNQYHTAISGSVTTPEGDIAIGDFASRASGKGLTWIFAGNVNDTSAVDGTLLPATFGADIDDDNAAHEVAHQLGNNLPIKRDPAKLGNALVDTVYSAERLQQRMGIGLSVTFEKILRRSAGKIRCEHLITCRGY